jgi:hypothetical protein
MVARMIVSAFLVVLMVGTTAICKETEKPSKPEEYVLKVLTPNGGEKWTVNTAQMIIWELNSPVAPDSIRIRLMSQESKKSQKAAKDSRLLTTIYRENPGKWEWDKASPVKDGMKIQVEAFFAEKKKVSDASDAIFSIVAEDIPAQLVHPEVKILSPNGGEALKVGTKHMIKWTTQPDAKKSGSSANVSALVEISLSDDGGTTWVPVTNRFEIKTGEWEWTIPNKVGENYRLRVALFDEKQAEICQDDSDANFRITASDVEVPQNNPTTH